MSKKKLIKQLAQVIEDFGIHEFGCDESDRVHILDLLTKAEEFTGETFPSVGRNDEMIEAIRQVNINPLSP